MKDSSLGTALVTGSSEGIGAIYANRLAKRGYDLILVARNAEKLEYLAAGLTKETGRSVKVLPADLSADGDLAKVEATLRGDPSIVLLVNNAGTASVAPLLTADVEKMEDIIDLHITALTRLTYAAAPAFVARGVGTIINIASVVGISPETLNGVYGASKAYVTATELWAKAGLPYQNLPSSIVMSPEGRCGAGRAGSGRAGHDSGPPRWRRMDPLRGRASRHLDAIRHFRAGAEIPDWFTRIALKENPHGQARGENRTRHRW